MRTSLRWPITLGVTLIVLLVLLLAGWTLLPLRERLHAGLYWTLVGVGAVLLVLVLVGVVLYLIFAVQGVRLNQRQSNFIDSVTHELKSPIASLKLYLQTLNRRSVTEAQQFEFYRVMLKDVERLDTLINHMLEAANVDQQPEQADVADVDLPAMLRSCAETACSRYHLPPETIELELEPSVVRARPLDIELVFRNLIDNAIKYGGTTPQVQIESHPDRDDSVVTRIIDNGRGIPKQLRRKIFGRFVRLGSELERSRTGTGLGLFIVQNVVKRLRGRVTVRDRGSEPGTVFEVRLPLATGAVGVP